MDTSRLREALLQELDRVLAICSASDDDDEPTGLVSQPFSATWQSVQLVASSLTPQSLSPPIGFPRKHWENLSK